MPFFVLNYYADKKAFLERMVSILVNTKRNALKKFYLTNDLA
jgi:hypothetical protein